MDSTLCGVAAGVESFIAGVMRLPVSRASLVPGARALTAGRMPRRHLQREPLTDSKTPDY